MSSWRFAQERFDICFLGHEYASSRCIHWNKPLGKLRMSFVSTAPKCRLLEGGAEKNAYCTESVQHL